MFFVTLRTEGGHFDPPANSETKEARTRKLSTVIAYYTTSITKQLKFLNSHCAIVCSYCSVVCLNAKMIEFSRSLKLNKIHIALLTKIPNFQGNSNFGGGTAGKFRKNRQ